MKKIQISQKKVVLVRTKTHNVICIDFSGSMQHYLPSMGEYLIEKINLLSENDKVTLIYFSGVNQVGEIIADFLVNDATDRAYLASKIRNRFNNSIGQTGFKEPLDKIGSIKKEDGYVINTIFLTDGYDNQWSNKDILASVDIASKNSDMFSIIEFGDYCNHDLLCEMLKIANNNCPSVLGFATNNTYQETLSKVIDKEVLSSKKIPVSIEDNVLDFIFSREFFFEKNNDDKYYISEDFADVSYFDGSFENNDITDLYFLSYHLALRKNKKLALESLKNTYDTYLFNKYADAVTIQEQNKVITEILEAARDISKRYIEGKNQNLEIDYERFCVLDLLGILSSDDNYIYTKPDKFKYNRIGRQRIQRSTILTDEEKEIILQSKDIENIRKIVNNKYELKFEDISSGFSLFKNFVFSQEEGRANISINVKSDGYVDCSMIPNNEYKIGKVQTFRYNNYTIIKDGRLNVNSLFFRLTENTFNTLKDKGLIKKETSFDENEVYEIAIHQLPVMNYKYLTEPKFSALIEKYFELETLKAKKKVYDNYFKEHFEKKLDDLGDIYGKDVTEWLKNIGIGYNGFSPKYVMDEATDVYQVNSLKINFIVGNRGGKLTLPTVDSVKKKILEKKPLSIADNMINTYIIQLEKFLLDNNDIENTLKNEIDNILSEKRLLETKLMKTVFGIVAGGIWFSDLDVNTKSYTLNTNYGDIGVDIQFQENMYEI